jgi:two-component system, cell cycle response regulator DivK
MAETMVLVVDDNADQREIASTFLRHHGYHVVEAAGGTEAIAIVRDRKPDGILLDLMMADPDGWEVTHRLKHDADTAGIPIIAVTVRHAKEDRERAEQAGADAYLIKPCLPSEMLEEVRRIIGPPRGPSDLARSN